MHSDLQSDDGFVDCLTINQNIIEPLKYLQAKWIPGYFLFVMMFGKLSIYCVLGTFVELQVRILIIYINYRF